MSECNIPTCEYETVGGEHDTCTFCLEHDQDFDYWLCRNYAGQKINRIQLKDIIQKFIKQKMKDLLG